MVMESYFTKYTMPKGPNRRKNKAVNELDPKNKGKTKYRENYGIDYIGND